MDIRDEVLSIEQAKELIEMGIDLNKICTTFIYKRIGEYRNETQYQLIVFDGITELFELGDIATLTSDEMLEMLPDWGLIFKHGCGEYRILIPTKEVDEKGYNMSTEFDTNNFKDTLFEAVKYCKKHNILKL